jgi:hypothetical protein
LTQAETGPPDRRIAIILATDVQLQIAQNNAAAAEKIAAQRDPPVPTSGAKKAFAVDEIYRATALSTESVSMRS